MAYQKSKSAEITESASLRVSDQGAKLRACAPQISIVAHPSKAKPTKANAATLLDFLIVKRTLAIKGKQQVAITQGEAAYIQATRELAGAWNKPNIEVGAEREIFNVFASHDVKQGFRSGKYISNGTGTTIGGNPWKAIIEFSSDTPRLVSFKNGYEAELAGLLLKDAHQGKPSLVEIAIWHYRRADIESILGSLDTPSQWAKNLQDQFISDCGLNSADIAALFNVSLTAIELSELQSDPADPHEYLPGQLMISKQRLQARCQNTAPACACAQTSAAPAKPPAGENHSFPARAHFAPPQRPDRGHARKPLHQVCAANFFRFPEQDAPQAGRNRQRCRHPVASGNRRTGKPARNGLGRRRVPQRYRPGHAAAG